MPVSEPVNQNPEQIARDQIDKRLLAAGWLVQTPAEDFGHGEGLSEAAQHGVETAPRIASAFLRLNC